MRRRDLRAVLGGAAVAAPGCRAQQKAMPVIGYLAPDEPSASASGIAPWREGLGQSGFVEGQNVVVEYRSGNGDYGGMPALATELVARHVDLIMASTLPAAVAAKSATSRIPIVFWVGFDLVAFGLVHSLNRPGGNLTGVTFLFNPLAEKRLQLLHDLVPGVVSIGLLLNPKNPNASPNEQHTKSAGALELVLTVLTASSADEIEADFATAREKGIGALLIGDDPSFDRRPEQLVAPAARYAVPAMYFRREFAVTGRLITYGPIFAEMARQAGIYAGRILKGEKPTDLPVARPTRFELVINLKTATALGLTVPTTLLALADEVIE